MARRAASISRAVMRARLVAFSPYSPKDTWAPRVARPPLRPLNCLRYLVRFGCSMLMGQAFTPVPWARRQRPAQRRAARRRGGGRGGAGGPPGGGGPRRGGGALGLGFFRQIALVEHLALEDPHLDADDAVGGMRLRQPVVDIGTEGVQRDAALAVPLSARDFRAVEAPGHAHLHAERTGAHGAHHRTLHGAAEHHALLDLLRDGGAHQLRVELRLSDLGDVDLLGRALELDAADGALLQLVLEELAHAEVSVHVQRELLLAGIPAAGPVAGDAEAYPDRIDLLTHALVLLTVAHCDGDVAVALDDARTAPLGAGGEALELRGCIHLDERDLELIDVRAVVVLGVGHRRLEQLAHQLRALLRHEFERGDRAANALTAHHVHHQAALLRRDARVAQFGSHLHRVTSWRALRWRSPPPPCGPRSAP